MAIRQRRHRPAFLIQKLDTGFFNIGSRVGFDKRQLSLFAENKEVTVGIRQRAVAETPLQPFFLMRFRVKAFENLAVETIDMIANED